MKKILLLSLLALGCSKPAPEAPAEQSQKASEVNPAGLVGKTIEYNYGEDIYHVILDTDSTLHWVGVQGGEKGVTGDETYFMESLDSSRIFISWDEANGIAVSQVLDFEQGKVYNHLMQDRKLRHGYGQIRVLP